ncbi:hypothetical protein [Aureliella helgolandensis]|uniref:HicB-like antitoxin of toxin-antitoxin system domain-containing protein n=1 Tax=Aureliella helgolandensis TaxID=2527968 RepID=A0A518GD87_9BACT|nr:hypothetical protein [Aureliella helgolandensis]QDV26562.1 hypothetical protein Q31a_49360 [Aureliella helgolandensis]
MNKHSLPQSPDGARPAVPVYNLTIFVAVADTGGFRARIANLELESMDGPTMRDALSKSVQSAKEAIRKCLENQQAVPWRETMLQKQSHEQQFLVPLHL